MKRRSVLATFAVLAVSAVSASLGESTAAHAIEGGRKATSEDVISHSIVAVNVHFAGLPGSPPPNPPDHSLNPCTGIIVDDDLVLTAAHCIKQNSSFQIIFSANAGDSQAHVKDVSAFDVPLEFKYGNPNPSARSDIAMVYFQGGLPAGYVKAELLLDETALKAGAVVSAAGYGPCRDSARCFLSVLDNTSIPRDDFWPTELQLQASSSAYPTSGDSGGPAFVMVDGEPRVFGIDNGSWSNLVEVYSAIGAHADWMKRATVRLRTTNISQGPGWGPADGTPGAIATPAPSDLDR